MIMSAPGTSFLKAGQYKKIDYIISYLNRVLQTKVMDMKCAWTKTHVAARPTPDLL